MCCVVLGCVVVGACACAGACACVRACVRVCVRARVHRVRRACFVTKGACFVTWCLSGTDPAKRVRRQCESHPSQRHALRASIHAPVPASASSHDAGWCRIVNMCKRVRPKASLRLVCVVPVGTGLMRHCVPRPAVGELLLCASMRVHSCSCVCARPCASVRRCVCAFVLCPADACVVARQDWMPRGAQWARIQAYYAMSIRFVLITTHRALHERVFHPYVAPVRKKYVY